jgi:RecJ-like exonuclease
MPQIEFTSYTDDTLTLPAKWDICHRCHGEGTHTNPAVDGHGITQEEMDELGPEFEEDYFSGVYDITCEECHGSGKVLVPDEGKCDPHALAVYHQEQIDEANYRAEVEAERRMGA